MSKKPFFITTPIYYVNDAPHIGHAYTTVAADIFSRFKKQYGTHSLLLTGTDEHGIKIAEAAEKQGLDPKEYADKISSEFKDAWEHLGVAYDRFIRTTDEDHEKTAKEFLIKLNEKGYIKKAIYKGLYCVGHEKFMSPDELTDGVCPDHGRAPVEYEEENYFFLLSKFEEKLLGLIASGSFKIYPEERKNEILGKLKGGLEDISISRNREKTSWGIEIPWDSGETLYVWVEALINYYTFGKQKNAWPADLQIIGKDILWFHAVIWPAMLLAIGEDIPKAVFAHGFFTVGGRKMSKTLGNVITPQQLIEKFGRDAARYLIVSAFPFGIDGDFDWKRLEEKYNADLANGIGNAVSRITTLATGMPGIILGADKEIENTFSKLHEKYRTLMSRLDFYGGVGVIQEMVQHLDKYLNEMKPWALLGEEKKKVMRNCLGMLSTVIGCANPFMPDIAENVFRSLGLTPGTDAWNKIELKIERGANLFPRT